MMWRRLLSNGESSNSSSSKSKAMVRTGRKEKKNAEIKDAEVMRQKEEEKRARIEEEGKEEKRKEVLARKGAVLERTEMSQNRVDFTQGAMGLVDRMESHRAGTYMKNVVISNTAPPDRELNLSRLRTFKAENEMDRLNLSDIPSFDLTENFVELRLIDAIPTSMESHLRRYTLVSDIFIHYIPLDTFYTTAFSVDFFVNDFRRNENTAIRHFPLTHSAGYNVLFSLDYCVRTTDLKHLTLSISTSLNAFKKDVAWGTVKIIISLTHMDFPIKSNIQETMGVLHLSDSDLNDFISDPRNSDGVITPEAMNLMKQAYKRGDVEKINQSVDDRKEINTAKTEFSPNNQVVGASDLLRGLREQHLQRERSQNAAPSESHQETRPPLKSAFKPKPRFNAPSVEDEEEDLGPNDSLSADGLDPTIEISRSPPIRLPKTVNYGPA